MSVFHRVDDLEDMCAGRFFAWADRLHAYRGVMRMRAEVEANNAQPAAAPPAAGQGAPRSSRASGKPVTYYDDVRENPEIGGLFGPRG